MFSNSCLYFRDITAQYCALPISVIYGADSPCDISNFFSKIWRVNKTKFGIHFDFCLKFRFLTEISIFDQNFNFWPKFRFLTEIWQKLRFLPEISFLSRQKNNRIKIILNNVFFNKLQKWVMYNIEPWYHENIGINLKTFYLAWKKLISRKIWRVNKTKFSWLIFRH